MDKFWWHTAWGLCLLHLSLAQQQIDLNVTCRYAGVFHVEKNGRYSISRTEAADLCQAFNSTLPTMDQMKLALSKGFETCRYGFIEGNVVIPRIQPNAICAANNTGVYVLNTSNTSHYDTYCFNASAPLGEDCTSVTDLPNSFDGPVTITIVNRDGTRYSKKGEYRTHQEDIDASNIIDDDVSSGSTIEKSTPEGYIFHTYLPTEQPTGDQDDTFMMSTLATTPNSTAEEAATRQEKWFENEWQGKNPPTPSEDSHVTEGTTASAHNSHPSQRITTQSQEDVSWTDFFDPISHPMGQGHQTEGKDTDSSHSTTLQPTAAPNTHLMEDLNRTGPLSVTTPQSHSQNFSTLHGELEEDENHPTTSILPSSTKSGTKVARRGESLPRDTTTSLEGYSLHYPDTMENGTHFPVTPAKTEVFGETEVTLPTDSSFNVDDSFPGDRDSSMDSRGGSRTVTHGSELAGHSSGNQDNGVTTTSGPLRRPQIPEWLIILASLLALALILAVCIAVNSRRRCGQKKKLVINSGNGTVEDRKPSELNGEASKSQEMVHLVNKEPSESPDQFMTADETRNLQSVDMKIGV
ncbi:CD44 antigen isoform X6 [Mus pahari]|uniref:CD44 antigen isoform X6 n=1 Tax=Mus pahari TaxID=10093 RepID=UPI000A30B88E|nr:CD44 antigen isoform X6 [Mus pahari]